MWREQKTMWTNQVHGFRSLSLQPMCRTSCTRKVEQYSAHEHPLLLKHSRNNRTNGSLTESRSSSRSSSAKVQISLRTYFTVTASSIRRVTVSLSATSYDVIVLPSSRWNNIIASCPVATDVCTSPVLIMSLLPPWISHR